MEKRILAISAVMVALSVVLATPTIAGVIAAMGASASEFARVFAAKATSQDQAAWLQAAGGLLAVLAALTVPFVERHIKGRAEHKTAAMIVSADLYEWMEACCDNLLSTSSYIYSGGADGELKWGLPLFRFEGDLGRLSGLNSNQRRRAYTIIRIKAEADAVVRSAWAESYDYDDVFFSFSREAAPVYFACLRLMNDINTSISWDIYAPPRSVEYMARYMD